MSVKISVSLAGQMYVYMPPDGWRDAGMSLRDRVKIEQEGTRTITLTKISEEEFQRVARGRARVSGVSMIRVPPGFLDAYCVQTSAKNLGLAGIPNQFIPPSNVTMSYGRIRVRLPDGWFDEENQENQDNPSSVRDGSLSATPDMMLGLAEALSVVNAAINEGYATPNVEDGRITLTVRQVLRG